MHRFLLSLMLVLLALPSFAEERSQIGKARIFNNDFFGDRQDRWRSGSYAISLIRGPEWRNALPATAGQLIEYRFRTEIIAPSNLANPIIGTDRQYAGVLSLGMFTHFSMGEAQISAGLDLVATGPQTGIGRFQTWAHQITGDTIPAVLGSQIGNGVHPTVNFEIGRDFEFDPNQNIPLSFRPFLEAQAGVETFIRFGGDLTVGRLGRGGLRVRDVVTGHRALAIRGNTDNGVSLVLGADAAFVAASKYLPPAGYTLTNSRLRVRAGIKYEREKSSFFYGLTWLGKEFEAQKDTQIVGSLSIRLRF